MSHEKPNYAKIKLTKQKPPVPFYESLGTFGKCLWRPIPRTPLLGIPEVDEEPQVRPGK